MDFQGKRAVVGVGGQANAVDLTLDDITQRDADQATFAVVGTARGEEIARADSMRTDGGRADLLNRLRTATPAQIDTWVDNNVTSIAAARTLFKAIIKIIALDQRS